MGRHLADNLPSANRNDHQMPRRLQIGRKPLGVDLPVENLFRDVLEQPGGLSREATRCDLFRHRSVNLAAEGGKMLGDIGPTAIGTAATGGGRTLEAEPKLPTIMAVVWDYRRQYSPPHQCRGDYQK